MKKVFYLAFLICFTLLLYSNVFAGTKEEYISYLKQNTSKPIQEVFYDDFDNNGSYEMFAIVGERNPANEYSEETIVGNVYYVNDLFTQKNQVSNDDFEENHIFSANSVKVINLGSCKHLYIDRWFQTANVTLVYEAHIGTPLLNIGDMNYIDNNNIICNVSSYDICRTDGMWTGHSWKDYWFYWDDKISSYCEYAAIPITKEQFLMFNGADKILYNIKGEITDILYRGNGIININVKNGQSNDYVMSNYTLRYDDSKVWIETENEGYYLPSIADNSNNDCTQLIANYPKFVSPVIQKEISVILNGNTLSFDVAPYIENGTTRVPMRKIFESLGATVEYDANTKTITARKGSTVIELITGASIAKINGREMTLTSSVENKNGSTMVPLRFVSEALGAEVIWDAETKTVTINLVETNADKDSLVNPLVGHSNVILTIYDNRNSILDGITWSAANIADGAKHIINIEEEVPDVEQGKCVLASILANVPEIENEPVDTSKYADISKLASDGTSIIEDYFGTSTKETKLLQNSIEKLGDIIDWTAFSIEEIDFILRDYKKNIQYFVLLQSNCDDEYVNAVIDDLMQDYTDKWYKTIIDVNEKIADEVVDKGLDVGVGFYTAGLYPLAKYSSEAISTLTGLKGYTDSLANFYQVCRMIYPVDKTLDSCLTKYRNGECTESELQAAFELNRATKIYAYECITKFGKSSDKDRAYLNIQDLKQFELNNGEIVYNGGNGGGGMGFR